MLRVLSGSTLPPYTVSYEQLYTILYQCRLQGRDLAAMKGVVDLARLQRDKELQHLLAEHYGVRLMSVWGFADAALRRVLLNALQSHSHFRNTCAVWEVKHHGFGRRRSWHSSVVPRRGASLRPNPIVRPAALTAAARCCLCARARTTCSSPI